jgi:hypothetical protein
LRPQHDFNNNKLTLFEVILMNDDVLNFQKIALQKRRGELLQEIADCANSIKEIDQRLAVAQSEV